MGFPHTSPESVSIASCKSCLSSHLKNEATHCNFHPQVPKSLCAHLSCAEMPKIHSRPTSIWSGWWYTYPSEKYESQLGLLFPIYGKIEHMFQTTNQWNQTWCSSMLFPPARNLHLVQGFSSQPRLIARGTYIIVASSSPWILGYRIIIAIIYIHIYVYI